MASWAIADFQNNTPMPKIPMIQVNEFLVPDDDFMQSNLERLPNMTRTEMSKAIITRLAKAVSGQDESFSSCAVWCDGKRTGLACMDRGNPCTNRFA